MSLVNIQNTNFENGITNRNAAALFGSMGHLDPTKFSTYMEDFHAPNIVSDELDGFNDITTGTVATADLEGGGILITTGATDTNVGVIQTESLGFSCVASRPLYFRGKLETADVVEADILVGLMDAVASIAPADGIFFLKPDDDAGLVDIIVRSGAAEIATHAAITTMVDDVQMTFEFYWDGIDRVYYGIDGVPLGFLTVPTVPTGLLAPTVGAITGATAAKTVVVDYLFASQER